MAVESKATTSQVTSVRLKVPKVSIGRLGPIVGPVCKILRVVVYLNLL